jgi:hypothetical protein
VSDPFKINEPTCLSVSGGRTSMYMLRRTLDANDGKLPSGSMACFANTGKEAPETLRFVQDCSERWGVPIHWVEFVSRSGPVKYRVVDFATASRESEPFDALIAEKKFLPNVAMRFCTEELKVKPIIAYTGLDSDSTMVGVRADEPHRIAKMRARGLSIPLVDAGIGKADVRAFWKAQPFDLGLVEVNGVTPDGNCDNCFLKPLGVIVKNAQRNPQGIKWWARKEREVGGTFAKDRPSYSAIEAFAVGQRSIDFDPNEEAISCFCGD